MATQIQTIVSRVFAALASLAAVMLTHQASAAGAAPAGASNEGHFKTFLVDLMNEPAKVEAFRENPDTLLAVAKLSPSEKDALRRRDAKMIQLLLAQESGKATVTPISNMACYAADCTPTQPKKDQPKKDESNKDQPKDKPK